jgi:iron-sulfur cluster assembly protein
MTAPMITLTDAAAERVKRLMAKAKSDKPVLGLRVGVKTRGCSGLSYFVEYAEEQKKFEDVSSSRPASCSRTPTRPAAAAAARASTSSAGRPGKWGRPPFNSDST